MKVQLRRFHSHRDIAAVSGHDFVDLSSPDNPAVTDFDSLTGEILRGRRDFTPWICAEPGRAARFGYRVSGGRAGTADSESGVSVPDAAAGHRHGAERRAGLRWGELVLPGRPRN